MRHAADIDLWTDLMGGKKRERKKTATYEFKSLQYSSVSMSRLRGAGRRLARVLLGNSPHGKK